MFTYQTMPAGLPAPQWPVQSRPVSQQRSCTYWPRADSLAEGTMKTTFTASNTHTHSNKHTVHADTHFTTKLDRQIAITWF